MNRIKCVSHLLADQNRDGAFLVRVSETDNVGHVLSGNLFFYWMYVIHGLCKIAVLWFCLCFLDVTGTG